VISYLAISRNPANRLYYGTSLGKVFRLDNANTGNPVPVEITGANFPQNAFVAYIDINPANADNLMVTFSNYGVQSLFHSTDGGASWATVGGNLEEFPDGSGAGPSIRCTKMLLYQGKKIIFAGTSSGLFSTRELNGDSTIWVREGASTIGNVIVDDIDTRLTDGFMAVGTHGNGVYSGYFNPSAGIGEKGNKTSLNVGNIFPNPVVDLAGVEIFSDKSEHLSFELLSNSGKTVKALPGRNMLPGKENFTFFVGDVPAGVYFLVVKAGQNVVVRKMVIR
jgi:hypothetical protein